MLIVNVLYADTHRLTIHIYEVKTRETVLNINLEIKVHFGPKLVWILEGTVKLSLTLFIVY